MPIHKEHINPALMSIVTDTVHSLVLRPGKIAVKFGRRIRIARSGQNKTTIHNYGGIMHNEIHDQLVKIKIDEETIEGELSIPSES